MSAIAQVLPFQFDTQEIRTLLIDDQPWFIAADVARALQYQTAKDMARNLDDDERGRQIVPTPSGDQEMTIINESGLYSAILRSRKTEAKRFKKWVTAEVLPAIRQHGRYDIATATIGTDGLHILHELIGKKINVLPGATKRQARAKLWSLVHTRFNVPRAEMIPAAELESACNFIAACALDGQWLPAPANDDTLNQADQVNLYALCSHMLRLHELYRQYHLREMFEHLQSPIGPSLYGHLTEGASLARRYQPRLTAARERLGIR
ncbi:BRO-N domain-containing protein [Kushneria sp. Sum13]|uniref:BRO-N domain-containing protein n=1 Tax=Kushneria sp. Sum13 TaxID=3459196 RepID=UPI004045A180